MDFREHIVEGLTATDLCSGDGGHLHYLWLSFDNSLHAQVITNTHGQPEILGGITSMKDGSALTAGPTARSRTGCSNDSVNVLVDRGGSEHYFDDAIIPGFRDRLEEYKVLDVPRKLSTTWGGGLNGIAQGVFRGHVIDNKGCGV